MSGFDCSVSYFRGCPGTGGDKDQGGPKRPAECSVPLQRGPSPINVLILAEWLLFYPDREAVPYLLDGFIFGFRIPVQGDKCATSANNLKSVRGMEDVVRKKIDKEVVEGRVVGPFVEPLVPKRSRRQQAGERSPSLRPGFEAPFLSCHPGPGFSGRREAMTEQEVAGGQADGGNLSGRGPWAIALGGQPLTWRGLSGNWDSTTLKGGQLRSRYPPTWFCPSKVSGHVLFGQALRLPFSPATRFPASLASASSVSAPRTDSPGCQRPAGAPWCFLR